jgi:pre-rRNA-processing protein TSR2
MSSVNASTSNTNLNPIPSFTPIQTQKWELGVSLILNFWQPLRDAIASSWGGPESADKRDWLCGVIADIWIERPETDEYDIEEVLLGVMEDEFEVAVEDDSAFDVFVTLMKLLGQC